jgi:hypothetical protein
VDRMRCNRRLLVHADHIDQDDGVLFWAIKPLQVCKGCKSLLRHVSLLFISSSRRGNETARSTAGLSPSPNPNPNPNSRMSPTAVTCGPSSWP